MVLNTHSLKSLHSSETLYLLDLLSNSQNRARFIGGCVRDCLLGKKVKDVDIATFYEPQNVLQILTENNIKVLLTGIAYGSITVIYNDKKFEVTSLREDLESNGRHVKVRYTQSWEKDSLRRDFTINALSYDPVDQQIFDYNNGLEDLSRGVVRFIGDPLQRILEDHLRILRYLRFTITYSKSGINKQIQEIIYNNKELLTKLSGERIRDELFKMLSLRAFTQALQYFKELDLLNTIFGKYHAITEKQLTDLPYSPSKFHILRSIFLLFKSKEGILDITKKWKLSNQLKTRLTSQYEIKKENLEFSNHNIKVLLYKFSRDIVIDWCYINRALNNIKLQDFYYYLHMIQTTPSPHFPVTGKDMLKKGIKKGEDIKKLLESAESLWIKSDFNINKTEILSKMKY